MLSGSKIPDRRWKKQQFKRRRSFEVPQENKLGHNSDGTQAIMTTSNGLRRETGHQSREVTNFLDRSEAQYFSVQDRLF